MAEKGKPNSGEPTVKLITPTERVAAPGKAVAAAGSQLSFSRLKYPIANHAALVKAMRGISQTHSSFFPIKSAEDLEAKLSQFYKVFVDPALLHPTSFAPPKRTRAK